MEFESFGLNPALLSAISDLNWLEPTEIQRHVIPLVLDNKNVLAWARTGSGKTGAFAVPIVEKILQIKMALPEDSPERAATRAIILAPTKELCAQAATAVAQLTAYCSRIVRCVDASAHASTDVLRPQLLERPDIVVGTPSGLLAHINAASLALESNKLMTVVVDEADLVFSFGYEEDFNKLRQSMPAKFQAILVSATLGSGDVKRLRKSLLKAGVWSRVELTESTLLPGADQLLQYSVRCSEEDRFVLLYSLIKLRLIRGKSLVFVNTVDRGYRVRLFLEQFGIRSVLLNAELPLATRCHVVQQFNKGLYDILIASDRSFPDGEDIEGDGAEGEPSQKRRRRQQQPGGGGGGGDREFGVSRGVDFQLVSNVINFDLPASAKAYVHRVGRTSRAGQQGTALSFVVSDGDAQVLARIETLVGQELRPFQFRMEELDGFRYRARDAMRAVTSAAVRESRSREIRQELLNSAKLRAHFADNPRDLHLLRHDKESHTARVQAHLRHVPEYIVPDALRDIVTGGGGGHKSRRRRNPRFGGGGSIDKEIKSGGGASSDKEIKGRRGGSGGGGPSIPMTADQRRRQRRAADPLYSARAALQLGRRGGGGGAKQHQRKPTKAKGKTQ